MKTIKIVHVQLHSFLSGAQRVTYDELKSLNSSLYDRWILCKDQGPLVDELTAIGVNFYLVPDLVRSINIYNDLLAFFKIYRFLKKNKFDIVHTHSSKPGFLGRLAAKFAGIPVVIHTVHGFSFPSSRSLFSRSLYFMLEWIAARCSTAIIVINLSDYEIARTSLGVDEDKIHLIPNGINQKFFLKSSICSREVDRFRLLGLTSGDSFAVGMIARLWEQKNPICFIKAAITFLSNHKFDSHFYLVGDGELMEELLNVIEESGFSGAIHLLGWRDDIPTLLNLFDVFVLPSRWEGLPLSIIEAMFAEVPVIASNIPGNNDLITNNKNGLLFESDDHNELCEKILLLHEDPDLRRALVDEAYVNANEKYTIDHHASLIDKLYKDMLFR
jgi:glycosyltransferase involved in cell wall biosynthesis